MVARKKKESLEDDALLQDEKVIKVRPKMPFQYWFDKALKAGKIRAHQEAALLVFFNKQGLSKIEDEDKYNEAFKSF